MFTYSHTCSCCGHWLGYITYSDAVLGYLDCVNCNIRDDLHEHVRAAVIDDIDDRLKAIEERLL